MRKNPLKTPEERRIAAHMLDALDTECGMLIEETAEPRLLCIALMMTACRIAATDDVMSPRALHRVFHCMLDQYTGDGT